MTKDEIRKYKREWARKKYYSNLEESRKKSLATYYEHHEERKERNRAWKRGHKEEVKNYNRLYLEKNREAINKRRNTYVAEKTGYAGAKVEEAIRSGKITPLACESCGEPKAQAHHDDYNKPLEVRWLCDKCHRLWHREHSPVYLKRSLA